MTRLILFEDEHLLVVNKPSGINTHKPDRFAPDGLHEWLAKHGRRVSILHRLDKDTSGILLFGKTRLANQSLSRQFESRRIEKTYLLLTGTRPDRDSLEVKSADAVTGFRFLRRLGRFFLLEARPRTGKTHQIRRHAAEAGWPVVGDAQYGGPAAPRLLLHAQKIAFTHPATGRRLQIEAPLPRAFQEPDPLVAASEFRELLFDERETNCYRLINAAADGFSGVVVDRYGGRLLVQWRAEPAARQRAELLEQLWRHCRPAAIYEQLFTRSVRTAPLPCAQDGSAAPLPAAERVQVRENGLRFLVRFGNGAGTGLFLDQRENRWRLLRMNLAGRSVLNCFAYTCAFSVAAARAGARVTSVDLSRSYLDWGRQNFCANGLEPAEHEFVAGEVFEWLRRFGRRARRWDVVILDPPTFSTAKGGRLFRAARDYPKLLEAAMPLLGAGGTLFCSTNQRSITAEQLEATIRQAGRVIRSMQYETVPFDFRPAAGERPYLKTFWVELE